MKKYLFLAVIPALISCRDGIKKEAVETTDTLSKSAAGVSSASFDDKMFKQLPLPLILDTTFVLTSDTSDRLSYAQVRKLGQDMVPHDLFSSLKFAINTFCEIDSLKEAGEYDEYVEKLDIGMTKTSIAFRIGVADLGNAKLFLWGIEESSYEACPFYSAKTIIATYNDENRKNSHFIIAERSGSGDPPAMMNEDITAKISVDGKIEIKSVMIADDMDIPGEETTVQTLVLRLEKDNVRVEDFKKEVKTTEKTVD